MVKTGVHGASLSSACWILVILLRWQALAAKGGALRQPQQQVDLFAALDHDESQRGMADDLILEPADADDYDDEGSANATSVDRPGTSSGDGSYIRLIEALVNQTVQEGKGVIKLRCGVIGVPKPTYEWFKDEAPLALKENSRRYHVKNRKHWSRLTVKEPSVFDRGHYRCEAYNRVGRVNSTAVIQVVPGNIRRGDALQPTVQNAAAQVTGNTARCVAYSGDLCSAFFGPNVKVLVNFSDPMVMKQREKLLKSSMQVIENSSDVTEPCKRYALKVSCYYNFPLCDMHASEPVAYPICRAECDRLEQKYCQNEYALAKEGGLMDPPLSLLPHCHTLHEDSRCVPILEQSQPAVDRVQWCYHVKGRYYRGTDNTSVSGQKCLSWDTVEGSTLKDNAELKGHNFCRNVDGKQEKPWCYVGNRKQHTVEYCGVRSCPSGLFPEVERLERLSASDSSEVKNASMNSADSSLTLVQYFIIAGSLAGLVVVVLCVVMICCWLRNRKCARDAHHRRPNGSTVPIGNHVDWNGHYKGNGVHMNGLALSNGNVAGHETFALLPRSPPFAGPLEARDIPRNSLRLLERLGEGTFGDVWKGELVGACAGYDGEPHEVAVKLAKPGMKNNFRDEALRCAVLTHDNIVQLIGKNLDVDQPFLVFEYMVNGDLHQFLCVRSPYSHHAHLDEDEEQDQISLDQQDFLHIATQIAAGMEFLASRHFVHRDLAARNCLVADGLRIKIADFGMARDVYASDYFRMNGHELLPVRWMPYESVLYGRFCEESDVWSFGVTLHEIYSYGARPYDGHTNEEVLGFLRSRTLLACPDACPTRMYSLMVECWQEVPTRRPRFTELATRLRSWSLGSPAHSTAVSYPPRASSAASATGTHSHPSSSATGPPGSSNHTATTMLTPTSRLVNGGPARGLSPYGMGNGCMPTLQTMSTVNGVVPMNGSPLLVRHHAAV